MQELKPEEICPECGNALYPNVIVELPDGRKMKAWGCPVCHFVRWIEKKRIWKFKVTDAQGNVIREMRKEEELEQDRMI